MTIPTKHSASGTVRRAGLASACVLSLALVFAVDWLTPPTVPFGPYYLIPVALAAWNFGAAPTGLMVLVASVARTLVLGRHHPMDGYAIYAVDIATTLAACAASAILLMRLRRTLHRLAAHAEELRQEARKAERRFKLQRSIRRAVPSDVDAIVALTVVGARTGDLTKDALDPTYQQALRVSHLHCIEHGAERRHTWTGAEAVVPVDIWVAHLNGKLAGYFKVMGLDDQSGSARELHAVATAAGYRGLGLGSAMVDFFCAHYHGRRQFAACMPDGRMHRMLTQRGFRHFANTNEGYVIVERPEWLRQGEDEPKTKLGFMPVGDSVLEPA